MKEAIDWIRSENFFLKASAVLRMTSESPLSELFTKILKEELQKRGIKAEIEDTDRFASADSIFSAGINSAMELRLNLLSLDPSIPADLRGILAKHFFDYARATNDGGDEFHEAFGAAIQCMPLLADREFASKQFPKSWELLLKAQKNIGVLFGIEMPEDRLIGETIRLLLIARGRLAGLSSREHPGSTVDQILKACWCHTPEMKQDFRTLGYFAANRGKFRVVGTMPDNDTILRGDYSLAKALEVAEQPDSYLYYKHIYDDHGVAVYEHSLI